jgi:hypothetical protein
MLYFHFPLSFLLFIPFPLLQHFSPFHSMFSRRPVTNGLTILLASSDGKSPAISDVLQHKDLIPSLRNEIPALREWIMENLSQMLRLALDEVEPQDESLGNQAARCFSWPSKTMFRALSQNQEFLDHMKAFVKDKKRFTNPVLVGRFQAIYIALFRHGFSLPDLMADVHLTAVNACALSGWQDFISTFMCDFAESMYSSMKNPKDPFAYLLDRVVRFTEKKEYGSVRFMFSTLTQIAAEQGDDRFAAIACDCGIFIKIVDSVRVLVQEPAEEGERRTALLEGVRFVRVVIRQVRRYRSSPEDEDLQERAKSVLRVHRQSSRSLFAKIEKTGQLGLDLFPAFWPAAIDDVWPIIFEDPRPAPDAAHAVLKVFRAWRRTKPLRLLKFVHEHRVLERLRGSGLGAFVSNPFPFRLALLLAVGEDKLPLPREDDEPSKTCPFLPPPPEWEHEWNEHTKWVVNVLWPTWKEVRKTWDDVRDQLKPRMSRF